MLCLKFKLLLGLLLLATLSGEAQNQHHQFTLGRVGVNDYDDQGVQLSQSLYGIVSTLAYTYTWPSKKHHLRVAFTDYRYRPDFNWRHQEYKVNQVYQKHTSFIDVDYGYSMIHQESFGLQPYVGYKVRSGSYGFGVKNQYKSDRNTTYSYHSESIGVQCGLRPTFYFGKSLVFQLDLSYAQYFLIEYSDAFDTGFKMPDHGLYFGYHFGVQFGR
ncbi:hypothetical protein KFE98_07435 [bacterium SCSIO 12741]|nr:hypothetical protein KFE98_07435 [bacterium SCSIO 12741]